MSIKELITRKSGAHADPFASVSHEVDRLLGDLAEGMTWPFGAATAQSAFVPAIDVENDEKQIRISAELPGMDEKDVQLTLQEGVITLRGEKKFEREENKKGAYRIERSYGAFERRFALPEEADAAKAEATFKKGVLTITVPKIERPQPQVQQIPVRTE